MTRMEINSPRPTRQFGGIIGGGLPADGDLEWLVYRLNPMSHYSDSWEWTIVERCNGKSIRNIVEILYLDELRKGAGLADIGIWKSIFDRSVVATVYDLAHLGHIRLLPSGESWKDAVRHRPRRPTWITRFFRAGNPSLTGKSGSCRDVRPGQSLETFGEIGEEVMPVN